MSLIQRGKPYADTRDSTIHVVRVPREVQRGLRMVSARRGMTMRDFTIALWYQAIDEELADYPEWRYQTKRPVKKDGGADPESSEK
jgi:hypothetical protein